MQTFVYTARTAEGKTVKAEVQAQSEKEAAKLLQSQAMTPIDIVAKGDEKSIFSGLKNRITSKDKIVFTRQLSTLISAGLPLVQSLRTVRDQIDNPRFGSVATDIISNVEGGTTLSDALGQFPNIFNQVYVNLVAAGESSGTLDETLERIAYQQEKDESINRKIRGALVYPAIVLLVITGVVVFMLTTVLPQIESLYADLGEDLPFTTVALLFLSNVIISYWWAIIMILIGVAYGVYTYSKTPDGREVLDRLKMKLPLFGDLFQMLYMARFTRTGATLMRSGVQMLDMMAITGRSVNNVHVEAALERAAVKVKGGKALSDSLKSEKIFLSLVPQMISIGEQSGALDDMMAKAASYYEDELDNKIANISTIIEPALMVVLGVVVGIIISAILLPVYGLVGKNF